jgi:hypothetical protein
MLVTVLHTSTVRHRGAISVLSLLLTAGCGGVTSETDVIGPSSARCVVSASAGTRTIAHSGGTASVSVSSARDCEWTARTDATWVTLNPTVGNGSATIRVTIASNPQSSTRTAHLVVNDNGFDLIQDAAPPPPPPPAASPQPGPAAPSPAPAPRPPAPAPPAPAPAPPAAPPQPPAQQACTFELNRTSESFDSSGGEGEVRVRARSGCEWEARSNASWISGGGSGSGDGEVKYRVSQNSSTQERSGTLSIAGQSFTVRQRGAEPPQSEDVKVDGRVGSLGGSCPNLSMSVGGQSVNTNSSTRFKHGNCSDIRSGVKVEVKGRRTGSGPIVADEVDIDRN